MFSIMIIGGEESRNYRDFEYWCAFYLQNKVKKDRVVILTTGDAFVTKFAEKFGIDVKFFPTNWKSDGKNALAVRNRKMIDEANAMIFFDNNIKDHNEIRKYAKLSGIPLREILVSHTI